MTARILFAALMLITLPIQAANCCPLCGAGGTGQTLAGEYKTADLIVVGVVKNAQQNLDDPNKNTTELHITTIIKDHPYLTGKKVLILPRYLPADKNDPDAKVLVFASVYPRTKDIALAGLTSGVALADFSNYTFDPYRGDPIGAKGELATYMKGAMDLRDKPMPERLQYYFKFLDNQDIQISGDAFLEFANADYKDVRAVAAKLPADTLVAWLNDPSTPPSHFGLYGMLLGHCGRKQDAAVLRKLLDEPKKLYTSGIDGMLVGYAILEPDAGWNYLLEIIKDPKRDFQVRYATMNVLRFFWDYRPDAVPKAKLLEAYKLLMNHSDIADMPIEDLRKRECYDLISDIIALGKSPEFMKQTYCRKALIKFILAAAPKNAEALAFSSELRGKYAESVKSAEESLQSERQAATPVK